VQRKLQIYNNYQCNHNNFIASLYILQFQKSAKCAKTQANFAYAEF